MDIIVVHLIKNNGKAFSSLGVEGFSLYRGVMMKKYKTLSNQQLTKILGGYGVKFYLRIWPKRKTR